MSCPPAVVTLLRGLYLWNRKPDWQAVFFGGYPHPFYRVWDYRRIVPVPTMARGACRPEGVTDFPSAVSRYRLGRLYCKFVCTWRPIRYSLCSSHGWGISARSHVQTALLYLRNGSADWVQFWCWSWGSWTRCLTQVMGGVSLHMRTCTPRFCISGTAWPIGFNFGMWVGGH